MTYTDIQICAQTNRHTHTHTHMKNTRTKASVKKLYEISCHIIFVYLTCRFKSKNLTRKIEHELTRDRL